MDSARIDIGSSTNFKGCAVQLARLTIGFASILSSFAFASVSGGAGVGEGVQREKKQQVSVLIDTDPAMTSWLGMDVDDDLALAFLLGTPHVRILAATATHGNSFLSITCRRLKVLLEELKLDIPMACGPSSWASLLPSFGRSLPKPLANAAADLLVNETRHFRRVRDRQSSGTHEADHLVWLSLGAMTNVAAALKQIAASSPQDLPDEIVILACRLDGAWDLNTWADLAAAAFLLVEAPTFVNVTVIPMEVMAGATVGMRELDRLRHRCSGSWVSGHVGLLKRFAWIAGHLQRGQVSQPANDEMSSPLSRPVHGFHPWDVGAAVHVAYPGQLFLASSCRIAQQGGTGIILGHEDVPCGISKDMPSGKEQFPVQVLTNLAEPQFMAVMFDGLCGPMDSAVDTAPAGSQRPAALSLSPQQTEMEL